MHTTVSWLTGWRCWEGRVWGEDLVLVGQEGREAKGLWVASDEWDFGSGFNVQVLPLPGLGHFQSVLPTPAISPSTHVTLTHESCSSHLSNVWVGLKGLSHLSGVKVFDELWSKLFRFRLLLRLPRDLVLTWRQVWQAHHLWLNPGYFSFNLSQAWDERQSENIPLLTGY